MARRNKQKPQLLRPKKLLIVAAILVIAGLGLYALVGRRNNSKVSTTGATSKNTPLTVVATPPTAQDKAAVEQHKDDLVQQKNKDGTSTPPAATTPSGKKQVSVILVSASQSDSSISGGGYASGVFEDGGVCTLTITKGAQKLTGASKGFATSNYTNCPPITIAGAEGSGWSAVLSYESSTSSGASESRSIN
jgi:hypothetical protein